MHAHWAHLRDLWETLPLPSILYSRLNLLASGCLPTIRSKYCKGGNQFTLLHPVSWQTGKKAAGYSSSPYLLFRTQHKSPGESEPIVLVTNKETSSDIIYIRFGRIKKDSLSKNTALYWSFVESFLSCSACIRIFCPHCCCFLQLPSYWWWAFKQNCLLVIMVAF